MSNGFDFLIYKAADEEVSVNAVIKDDTIWLTQKSMSELFEVTPQTITRHLANIYEEKELSKDSTCTKIVQVQNEGSRQVKRNIDFYNLDAIISVGYHVIKGFALDDDRLKQGNAAFGKDYFRELLERVRSIRASERRIWQQITDIFAECSIDYDKTSDVTKRFYATVQNKFHYAITNQTAAEIIYDSADKNKEHMGLTTWKNAPDGRILKSDVSIAKNYLEEKQIRQLERAVTGYFDYIEDLIERENTFTMEEFESSVNEFLAFRRYDILPDNGKVSHKRALEKAYREYDEFNKTQKIISDFDREIKRLESDNH